jgi:hypothetical protein
MDNRNPGCIGGLLRLFLLRGVFDWLQDRVGYGRGGCLGCGCGTVLMILFIILFLSIIFGTNWFEFRLMLPVFMV